MTKSAKYVRDQKVLLPKYLTAIDIAACGLSADYGLPLDEHGGISGVDFLHWLEALTPKAAKIFTSENPDPRRSKS